MADYDSTIADRQSGQWPQTPENHSVVPSTEVTIPNRPSPDTDYKPEAENHSKQRPKRAVSQKSKTRVPKRQRASNTV